MQASKTYLWNDTDNDNDNSENFEFIFLILKKLLVTKVS